MFRLTTPHLDTYRDEKTSQNKSVNGAWDLRFLAFVWTMYLKASRGKRGGERENGTSRLTHTSQGRYPAPGCPGAPSGLSSDVYSSNCYTFPDSISHRTFQYLLCFLRGNLSYFCGRIGSIKWSTYVTDSCSVQGICFCRRAEKRGVPRRSQVGHYFGLNRRKGKKPPVAVVCQKPITSRLPVTREGTFSNAFIEIKRRF
ncbi:hypothetical protein J6590_027862 [Homalodisca vitripennis]|nr:hypothetical protein J6590_027862 [Homalodisca vitripennis]